LVPVTRPRRALLIIGILVLTGAAILYVQILRVTPHVQKLAIESLEARFDSDVEIDSLQAEVFPQPRLSGSGLSVRWHRRADVPPLVQIGEFSASASAWGLLGTPIRLDEVALDRLEIHIPPGGIRINGNDSKGPAAGNQEPARSDRGAMQALRIGEVIAHSASLQIESKKAGKPPRVFDIDDLHIYDFGKQDGANFRATLTNPTPEGRVATEGRFGPWERDEPGRTPLSGNYTFKDANLDTIKGIGGILSSQGTYGGVLERIEVNGTTDTPDFSIDVAGQPVPLTTKFKAVVDGTNGDTWLEQVDAVLLQSHIHARGAVVRAQDVKGRHVALDITIDNARIQDLLKLAMKGTASPLTGAVKVKTKFFLPAGKEDVIQKLRLDGEFVLDQAKFTNFNVQRRISLLSQRGRGDETPDDKESVVSKLQGRFTLRDAALSFSDLTFAVPGATVQLAGAYDIEAETLDFRGHLLLDASLRDTTSGFKAVLATFAQPFFRRPGGGSKLPIRVVGTRNQPQFGLDVKRAFLPGN
jgi:hypothetical protein